MKRNKISPEQKLSERCFVLVRVIKDMRQVYLDVESTPTQKDLLETMIGAAIWYLPNSRELYTGMISASALKGIPQGEKPCMDHLYPRKIAGRELLVRKNIELNGVKLIELYKTKYGLYNLVTKLENKKLVKHQKAGNFVSADEAYKNAGIQLHHVSLEELRKRGISRKTDNRELKTEN